MMRLIPVLLLALIVSACSDGGGGSSNGNEDKRNFNPADFTLTQGIELPSFGTTTVKMVLNNLPSDDAIYVAVTSADIENQKLKVTPPKTMLNPSEGQAIFVFDLKDLGLTSSPVLSVTVTTAGNTQMTQTLTINVAS